MPTIAEMCADGLSHHQAGRLNEAERIYREVLAVDPNSVDALHLLGVVAIQMGQHDKAVSWICRAIELKGTESAFHSNLGYRAESSREIGRGDCRVQSGGGVESGSMSMRTAIWGSHCRIRGSWTRR